MVTTGLLGGLRGRIGFLALGATCLLVLFADVFLLAEAHFMNGDYRRAAHTLQFHGLLGGDGGDTRPPARAYDRMYGWVSRGLPIAPI